MSAEISLSGNVVKLPAIDLNDKVPNILLFGNGLSMNAGGKSTEKLLSELWSNSNFSKKEADNEKVHFPYQIIIGTEDDVPFACDKLSENMRASTFYKDKKFDVFKKYMNLEMDAFLTTNYSYEAEVAIDENFLKKSRLQKYMVHTDDVNRREPKFYLHSFYRIKNKDIWHIHGEAKNKFSVVIDQYNYGKLLYKMISYINTNYSRLYTEQTQTINTESWIDYFLIGNIYIVGLGLSMAEYDLWWLLNNKKRNKNNKGKVFYYCNKKDNISGAEKEMLRLQQVEVVMDERAINPDSMDYYNGYYNWVYEDISNKMNNTYN